MRDDARHVVKKTQKEINRLFGKKFSIDVAEGGRIKKHSRGEFNFEVSMIYCKLLKYLKHIFCSGCDSEDAGIVLF
jgi:hypothetical protein